MPTPGSGEFALGERVRRHRRAAREPTVEIPPRPADLPLDDVEPCALFTKAQLRQLGIDQAPEDGTEDGQLKGPTCTIEIRAANLSTAIRRN